MFCFLPGLCILYYLDDNNYNEDDQGHAETFSNVRSALLSDAGKSWVRRA